MNLEVTVVLSHRGSRFDISTACEALGDGTPNPSGRTDVQKLSLFRVSSTRFMISSDAKPKIAYRWCSAESR